MGTVGATERGGPPEAHEQGGFLEQVWARFAVWNGRRLTCRRLYANPECHRSGKLRSAHYEYGSKLGVFAEWEKAFVDAYRDSPEVKRISKAILKGVETAEAKVRKFVYVIENIRYQQDYEVTIAGVAARGRTGGRSPVWRLQRYAVLFIALAREAGIDVHFTSV